MFFLSPSSHGTEANYSSPHQRTTFVFLITVAWKVSHPLIIQWFISSDKTCPSLGSLFLQTVVCVCVDNIACHSSMSVTSSHHLQGPFVHIASICAAVLSRFMSIFSGVYEVSWAPDQSRLHYPLPSCLYWPQSACWCKWRMQIFCDNWLCVIVVFVAITGFPTGPKKKNPSIIFGYWHSPDFSLTSTCSTTLFCLSAC